MPRISKHALNVCSAPPDARHLWELRTLLHMSQEDFSSKCGLSVRGYQKLEQTEGLRKSKPSTRVRIAKAFLDSILSLIDVDTIEFLNLLSQLFSQVDLYYARNSRLGQTGLTSSFSGWTKAYWPTTGFEMILVDLLHKAKVVLSCTQSLDSYILPSEMNQLFWKNKLEKEDLPKERKDTMYEKHMEFTDATIAAREKKSFKHRLIVSEDFLAKQHENDRIGILQNFRKYDGLIQPAIAEPEVWDRIGKMIANQLSLDGWHKLLVIDETIAVLWYRYEQWEFTQERDEVLRVKKVLEAALNGLPVERFDGREGKGIRNLLG
jgi:transcriptional regulator with XRE-family HTH domain